jgi:hypothetical protein
MAITRAQIARELYIKGGVVNPDGRRGFGGGATSGSKDRGYQGGGRDKKGSVKGAAPGAATVGPVEKGGGEGSNLVDEVALTGGTKTKPKVTKTKDKEKRNIVKDYFNKRKELAYNISRKLPGATASSFRNLTDFRNYLVSQGADTSTIDRLMEGVDEDNPINYENFQELAYDYEPKGITDIDKLRSIFKDPTRDPFEKLTAVPQNFSEFMLTQKNNPNLFTAGNVGNFMNMRRPKDLVNPNTGELYTNVEFENLKREIGQDRGLIEGGGRDDSILPISQPVASIPEPTGYVNPLSLLTPRIAGTRFLGTEFEDEEDTEFAADGGRIGAMGGGIMNVEDLDREAFLLGGIAKGLKKAVRGVKKIIKSPLGKAALIGAGFGLAGMGPFKGLANTGFGKGLAGLRGTLLGQAGSRVGEAFVPYKEGLLTKLGLTKGGGSFMPTFKGGITLASILPLLAGKTDEEKDDVLKDYYASQKLIPSTTSRQAGSEFDFYEYNLAEGGMPSKEPVAKKVMPLLDMDGMEKDYRAEGGFVPIGRMEKADDVPARLSKNEFVFTADAVRNAGEGDVDKGAEVMYNMMKNLESGGEVSEESQGLDGAREMFQTSQRLGEVI